MNQPDIVNLPDSATDSATDAATDAVTESATDSDALIARYGQVLMPTFNPDTVLVRGEGCRVWDANGKQYLDLLGGIAVNSLGHAHPLVQAAVSSQLATLGHISNFFASRPQIALADELVGLVGAPAKVFFTNSGTEANEAALKLTRRTGRARVIACIGGFHGRTLGALSITWKPSYREAFEPLPGGVEFVEYGDPEALRHTMASGDPVAAVVVEPIQGENGVRVPPDGYLRAVREACDEHGALMWVDEVQTGIGRTGSWFGYQHTSDGRQHDEVRPDIVTVAKGLGAGFPIGACIGLGACGDLFVPGNHGTTFGGNPPAAAAGLAVLTAIRRDRLLDNVRRVGDRLTSRILDLGLPQITEVRGRGLLLGIGLAGDHAATVADRALRAGFIVNPVDAATIRLAPPLILTEAEADEFVDALPGLVDPLAGDAA